MTLLSLENISKTYGEKPVLTGADFYLNEGEKVGIIGINGTGKTTLLRILEGMEEPDQGTRTKANFAVIRYLEQAPVFEPQQTVLDFVLQEVAPEERWQFETEAKTLLNGFQLTAYDQPCNQLSGGQKKRAALARLLVMPCDILILDEPTNHLDGETAAWLEEFLKQWKKALILVTHDRYFLDSVTTRIVEIHQGKLYSYNGSYGQYLEKKAEREEQEDAASRKRRNILRTELEWLHRGARARSTKQKAHIQRIEQLQNVKDPLKERGVEMSSVSVRMGRTTVELEGITKSYGDRCLIRDFSYVFLKEDRIGIIGSNGCGKTTLMKILAGKLEPDGGSRIVGQTIQIGYYTQEISNQPSDGLAYMDPKKRVIDYIRDTAEYVVTEEGSVSASVMLDRFLFPPSMQYAPIEKLSGGEKRRLYLLRILMEAPNLLLLDEPANDLDIQTMTILEDYLDHFKGIVVMVSHDRYFLDRMAKRIFAFEKDGSICQYEGGYTDYEAKSAGKREAQNPNKKESRGGGDAVKNNGEEAKRRSSGPRKLRMSYEEQRDYAVIEGEIEALEEKLSQLEKEIAQIATDYVKLNQLMTEKDKTQQQLEEKMERWMYLEDLAARIEAGELRA